MPTYTNNETHDVPLYYKLDGELVYMTDLAPMGQAGATKSVLKYAVDLGEDITLDSHTPTTTMPIILFESTVPSGVIAGLADYDSLIISNASDDVAVFEFNEDSDDALEIAPGMCEIELRGDFHCFQITSAGAGGVKVWGF